MKNKKMKCFIGLGNYPEKYHKTRHNLGFLFVDFIAKKYNFPEFRYEKKFKGEISRGYIENIEVILLKPHTYMNLSGESAQALIHFYKIFPEDIMTFSDDLDLPFGTIRFREKGSAGGQKGLKDIYEKLNTQEIKRIKFGISNELREKIPVVNFVLMKFTPDDLKIIPEIFSKGEDILLAEISKM